MMATKNPFQGDDIDPFSGVRDEEGGIRRDSRGNVSTPKPEPKKETFREAFARNRAAGKDTFTWNGKKYSTEMAKPAAKPAAKTAAKVEPPSAQTTARTAAANMGRPGPTKERAAAMPPMARPDASTSRGVRAEAPEQKPKTEMQRNTAANAKANRERMEAQRKAREERKAKSGESKPMFGRNPAGKTPAEVRKEKCFAKGGMVSARADGVAKRGKTKCKII
jgi:hypothetical protein